MVYPFAAKRYSAKPAKSAVGRWDPSEAGMESKMTQFHEGQDVEVADINTDFGVWLKAKIVGPEWTNGQSRHMWIVELNGEHLLFDAEHIRADREAETAEWLADHPGCYPATPDGVEP